MNTESASSWVQKNASTIVSCIVALVACLFIYSFFDQSQEIQVKNDLIESQNTLMVTYRNKDSSMVALTETLKLARAQDLLRLKSSDSIINQLQKIVEENKSRLKDNGSATVINSQGIISKTTPTDKKPYTPTVPRDRTKDIVEELPEYSTSFKDKWVNYSINANSDSISLKLKYKDIYSVVVGTEKDSTLPFFKKLFSEKKDYAWVTTESPYSEIKSTKTTTITVPPKPRLSVGIQAGYGLTAGNVIVSPYVGIGVSYRLFYLQAPW